ncbi:unnamed protein product [Prunus armeniaca]
MIGSLRLFEEQNKIHSRGLDLRWFGQDKLESLENKWRKIRVAESTFRLLQAKKQKVKQLDSAQVNNAGIFGSILDGDAFKAVIASGATERGGVDLSKLVIETYEFAEECLQINYYGAKRTAEALIPLLQLSDSPRIVNVSSGAGKLKNIPNDWAKGVFTDAENLTEERVDEVLTEFLKDFKEGSFESKGWPSSMPAYTVSKAALNAYTRILAKKYLNFRINSVCPGFVKTDINCNVGVLPVEEGGARIVKFALLPNDGPYWLLLCSQ